MSLPEENRKLQNLIAQRKRVINGLPHLYGFPWYKWAREFFESTNKINLMVAGNQLSKSSTQIRKCIHWATATELWTQLWKETPKMFWYLYPSKDLLQIEWEQKWKKEFMPRDEFKDHPKYGWEEKSRDGYISEIKFKSGVSVYFKTYMQQVSLLQGGTCFVAGTLISTPKGLVPIEDLRIGDWVETRYGARRIINTMQREAAVIERKFSNDTVLRGTPDHPFITNNGEINFDSLTSRDKCPTVRTWKLQKKLYCLRVKFLRAFRWKKIFGEKIIFTIHSGVNFMLNYGKSITNQKFLKGLISTIKTLTHWITGLKIWNVLPKRSIREFINWKNGKVKSIKILFATTAVKNSYRAVRSLLQIDTVHRNVGAPKKNFFACVAELLFWQEQTLGECTVQSSAPIDHMLGKSTVYNLTVEEYPEYFANGILVHNCHAIFTDEEAPIELFDELMFRLAATGGYFHMVFTATLNQEFWRCAMEEIGTPFETLTTAKKFQISMYDCLKYADGTPSPWTRERIKQIKETCRSENEIKRRVYGRFIKEDDLKYPSFDKHKNVIEPVWENPPRDWSIYTGVDIGSGGAGHPAAMVFVAVDPEYKNALVYKGWKGNKGEVTTAEDILERYKMLRGKDKPILQSYDWAAKDFYTHAARRGETFTPAEKAKAFGEDTLNSLFKSGKLKIFNTTELQLLAHELSSLPKEQDKRHAVDDFSDALRYAISRIPFDWAGAKEDEKEVFTVESEIEQRRKMFEDDSKKVHDDIMEEIEEINALCG